MTFPALITEVSFDGDAGPALKEAVLAGFPKFYYRLGDTVGAASAADSSGNALTAAKNGVVTFGVAGFLPGDTDTAASFDGADGTYLSVAYTPSPADLAAYTFEGWVKKNGAPATAHRMLAGWNNATVSLALLVGTGGTLVFQATDGGAVVHTITGAKNVCDNAAHWVAAVYDGAAMYLYVDGLLDAMFAGAFAHAIPTGSFVIGGMSALTGRGLAATLDEVVFYPGAYLTSDSAAYHYEARNVLVNYTWTDLSSRARELSTDRGKQYELDQTQPGEGTVKMTNADRAIEPGYSGLYTGARTLTVSGNEITDAVRALGVQGDGRTAPDSSFGIWEATTNLCTNGGFETNTTGWSASLIYYTAAGASLSRQTGVGTAMFGVYSCKCQTDGATINEGMHYSLGALTNGATYTFSAWILGDFGTSFNIILGEAGPAAADYSFSCTGRWQRVEVSWTATGNPAYAYIVYAGVPATFFFVDGAQVELKPIATPYVETNGGTASRSAARVQAPASLLDETKCWVTFRVAYGFPSTATRTGVSYLFDFRDDGSNWLGLYLDTANKWNAGRKAAAAGAVAQSAAQTFATDDEATIVFACDSGHVKVSTNGGAFTSVANTSIPTLAVALADLGTAVGGAQFNGDVLWFACGTGTLTDADAARFHALGNATGLALSDFELPTTPNVDPTLVWNADDAGFLTWGPYFPNVVPMRRMRLNAIFQSVTYPIMAGRVERWPEDWVYGTDYAESDVMIVDAFDDMNADEGVTISCAQEQTGARLSRLLQAIGSPKSEQTLDTGASACQTVSLDHQNALSHAQEVETTEEGFFFCARDGKRTFYDRTRLLTTRTPRYTFGDAPGELGYTKLVPIYDRSRIVNYPKVTRAGGTTQVVSDAVSQRMYRRRSSDVATLDIADAQAKYHSQYLSILYAQPVLHFETMECTWGEGSDPNLMVAMLDLELGDVITVIRRPTAAQAIQQIAAIEKISHRVIPGKWVTTFALGPAPGTLGSATSPTGTGASFWVMDSARLDLGTHTAL